jgi:hypothetical protein
VCPGEGAEGMCCLGGSLLLFVTDVLCARGRGGKRHMLPWGSACCYLLGCDTVLLSTRHVWHVLCMLLPVGAACVSVKRGAGVSHSADHAWQSGTGSWGMLRPAMLLCNTDPRTARCGCNSSITSPPTHSLTHPLTHPLTCIPPPPPKVHLQPLHLRPLQGPCAQLGHGGTYRVCL